MAASVDLPKKYKAAVYDKPGSISTKIEEMDMPEPGPGQVSKPPHTKQMCLSCKREISFLLD
jgi:hypothetical protein